MTPELSLIIPTLNEQGNIAPLIERLQIALAGIRWEIIFVDDNSTDGTLALLQSYAQSDARIRYIRRVGRKGLSSACLEGMASSSAPLLAVMDADLQHDEKILPAMLEKLQAGNLDIVIGSRYQECPISEDWSPIRRKISRTGIWLAQRILRVQVSDPLSGFFMLTRELFESTVQRVSGKGFKILLDMLVATNGNVRYAELPFTFRPRHAGESKLDTLVISEYALLLFDKTLGAYIPTRFFMFVCVGMLGAMLHLGILWTFLYALAMPFIIGQGVATFTAIGLNFLLNNIFTYRNDRLTGSAVLRGLVFFYIICSLGAFVNVLIASFLFQHAIQWWLAGLLGAIIGGVWNYAMSSVFVWPWKKPR